MNNAMLSSKRMDWCTPQAFFDELDNEFCFDLDVAATENNSKCGIYFSIEDDGLIQNWQGHTVFCNPPYGREIGKWVKKAYEESRDLGTTVVMLIPARTDTSYWHEYIFPHAEIRFLPGRLCFEDEIGTQLGRAPFPSAVVIFR